MNVMNGGSALLKERILINILKTMGIFSKISRHIKRHIRKGASSVGSAVKRLSSGDTGGVKRLFDDGLHSVKRLHTNISNNEMVGSLYRGGVGQTVGKAIEGVEKKRYLIDKAGEIVGDQRRVLQDLKSGNIQSAIKGQSSIIAKVDSGGKASNLKDLVKQKAGGAIEAGYSKSTKFIPDSVKKELGAMSAGELATRLGKTDIGRRVRKRIGDKIVAGANKIPEF